MSQAASENAPNKPVHLIYLMGTVIMFYLLQWSIDWIWGYFAPAPGEILLAAASGIGAITVGVAMYKNDKIYHLANEVASELKKVTWPTAKEVRASTTTVIVMALISALILGLFDFAWSNLTELVYG
jgi:preprotein translocase subunit SecE